MTSVRCRGLGRRPFSALAAVLALLVSGHADGNSNFETGHYQVCDNLYNA